MHGCGETSEQVSSAGREPIVGTVALKQSAIGKMVEASGQRLACDSQARLESVEPRNAFEYGFPQYQPRPGIAYRVGREKNRVAAAGQQLRRGYGLRRHQPCYTGSTFITRLMACIARP
jgi:hypothetical protein